ncbi:MAG TPA: hypothetical protein VMT68_16625 [Caulobacteraceae bacterium]|nr:hypothetical protein [Caulobacteraceae bacterium]
MRFYTAAFTVAAFCAAAATAVAAPARLSDAQYIALNRCLGIESSKSLGTAHEAAFRQLVKTQDWARQSYIEEKADEARQTAADESANSSAALNAKLVAERDGVCRSFLETTTASTPAPSHAM